MLPQSSFATKCYEIRLLSWVSYLFYCKISYVIKRLSCVPVVADAERQRFL